MLCGRGEFLKGFIACGVLGYAVDQSSVLLDTVQMLREGDD